MAEKNQYHPPAANGYTRNADAESLDAITKEERRKKRIKWAAYIAAFIVFQTVVILVFVMVVMKVRTPKFRIGDDITIQNLATGTTPSPSFNLTFDATVRIKNNNFGPYKYDAGLVNFTYGGVQVGQATIPKSKAGFMSTKKVHLTVEASSTTLPTTSGLSTELTKGVVTLIGEGRLNGKSEIMFIFKKKKAINMNCTMEFDVSKRSIKDVECK